MFDKFWNKKWVQIQAAAPKLTNNRRNVWIKLGITFNFHKLHFIIHTWKNSKFNSQTRLNKRKVAIITFTTADCSTISLEGASFDMLSWCNKMAYNIETAPTNSVAFKVAISWVLSSLSLILPFLNEETLLLWYSARDILL